MIILEFRDEVVVRESIYITEAWEARPTSARIVARAEN
jgi:hypothetical protein